MLYFKHVSGSGCSSQLQKGWQLWGDVWDAEGPGGLQEPDPGGHGTSAGEDEGPPHRYEATFLCHTLCLFFKM